MEFLHRIGSVDMTLLTGSWIGMFLDLNWAFAFLLGHYSRKLRVMPLYLIVAAMVPNGSILFSLSILNIVHWKAHLAEITVYAIIYGIFLYIGFAEWLMRSGARRLTEGRGEKWTKEMDYLYLSIGASGILFTIFHSNSTVEHVAAPDVLAVMLLITALVLRLIKVRAEIGDWNKFGRVIDPKGDDIVMKDSLPEPEAAD